MEKWGDWFQNDWFSAIEKLGQLPENENAYLGVIRYPNGHLEYWIGMFFPDGTQVPEGFDFMDMAKGEIAVCWIYGKNEYGEFFRLYNQCADRIANNGWTLQDPPCFIERFSCPRYTTPDAKGNVTLDYCMYIQSAD